MATEHNSLRGMQNQGKSLEGQRCPLHPLGPGSRARRHFNANVMIEALSDVFPC